MSKRRSRSLGVRPVSAHVDPWGSLTIFPSSFSSPTKGSETTRSEEREGVRGQRKEKKMREQIEKALEKIRPALQADGGDVELVDVAEGVVKVRLKGACGG
jgi:hypothetical protein